MSRGTAQQIGDISTDNPDWPEREVALFRFDPGLEGDLDGNIVRWEYGLATLNREHEFLAVYPATASGERPDDPDAWAAVLETYAFFQPTLKGDTLPAILANLGFEIKET
jgi:hypothetical protein